jgi:UDP-2,3-diacylglucosamine pyrophosphatase LpxH
MRYSVIELERAVMVSDLHCKPGSCKVGEIAGLAAREGASLVILGDLFDDLHREVGDDELERALRAVFRGVAGLEIYYVTSGSSHDPILKRETHLRLESLSVHVYPRALIARVGRLRMFLTHGDLALRNGAHAFLVNVAAMTLGKRLYLEKALKKKLRLPSDWWLVMGHTHIPGIDREARVANTGSWKASWSFNLPYWRPPSNTYIIVENGAIELRARGFSSPRKSSARARKL